MHHFAQKKIKNFPTPAARTMRATGTIFCTPNFSHESYAPDNRHDIRSAVYCCESINISVCLLTYVMTCTDRLAIGQSRDHASDRAPADEDGR